MREDKNPTHQERQDRRKRSQEINHVEFGSVADIRRPTDVKLANVFDEYEPEKRKEKDSD